MSYNLIEHCSNIEIQNDIFVFEIKITTNDNDYIKHRFISTDKSGKLLSTINNIKKIKVSLCLLNTMKIINFKKNIKNGINDTIIIYKENIVIFLSNNDNNIDINYKII
jgi:hypothetical protein